MELQVKEFLIRFSQHNLPKRVVKIRHYGIFIRLVKKQKLQKIKKALNQQTAEKKEKLSLADILRLGGRNLFQ